MSQLIFSIKRFKIAFFILTKRMELITGACISYEMTYNLQRCLLKACITVDHINTYQA